MQLIDRVRRFVRQHDLFRAGVRVVAAVSGGSDSVALAHVLGELDEAGELTLASIAHLNHQLRSTAGRDERFSIALAESLGVPAFVERAMVAARAARERRSVEDAGHIERHQFFERARQRANADVVAVGHTRDDQAETVLLRLVRGAGPQGLAGMHPRRGTIVRPLLGCRRRDLREYLAARHVSFVEDESNRDVSIVRNRVRAELIPLLESRFNPNITEVLADEAELARETWQWMKDAADELYGRAVAGRQIDLTALRAAPRALARVVLWRAMTEAAGGRPIAFAHVEAALGLVGGDRDGRLLDVPGQRLQRRGARLVLTSRARGDRANAGTPGSSANIFQYALSVPGEVQLPEGGCVISAEPMRTEPAGEADRRHPRATARNGSEAVVRSDLCPGPLVVRNRRPGDWFRPVGLGGKKKLQDFFVDRKVARERRDRVPLVVDGSNRIVWVAGYGIDEAFRVTDPAQGMLLLRLRQV